MTKRIAIAKSIEHAASLNIINRGDKMLDHHSISVDKMTTQEIRTQINLQKIHDARTKRAMNNLDDSEKTLAKYGGMYTQTEIKLLHDLHPYLREMANKSRPADEILNENEIVKMLNQLGMYAMCVQEDNYFMA